MSDTNAASVPSTVPTTANGTPPATTRPTTPAKKVEGKAADTEHRDSFREAIETVVFVVFLVLLLMSFVAQAFVIPTGSMATTLLGLHHEETCEKCGYRYLVNVRDEQDPFPDVRRENAANCPNCRHRQTFNPNDADGGDKVLVSKPHYDLFHPQRLDIIVFKFPGGPQKDYVAHNFIKRLWGLPGETLGIWNGDVYLRTEENGQERLTILRRPPDKILEMRRIVYDNDHPPRDLGPAYQRWKEEAAAPAWKAADDGKSFRLKGVEETRWLHYRNHLRPSQRFDEKPQEPTAQLITDFLAYNADDQYAHWVRDLMLDLEIEIERAVGEVTLELVSGLDTHQASFDLSTGQCTLKLFRAGKSIADSTASTTLKGLGKYHVRFANFDDRVTLWVDGRMPFADGWELAPPSQDERGPRAGDLRPAGIGVKQGEVTVRRLQLWRDIYYTRTTNAEVHLHGRPEVELSLSAEERNQLAGPFDKPAKWSNYYLGRTPEFYSVGPKEYFALGDNSTRSHDSRGWGKIPEHLLLGRAVWVYWPPGRFGLIR